MSSMKSLPEFHVHGSYHDVGLATGRRFAAEIQKTGEHTRQHQQELLPYLGSPEGQAQYRRFLELHQARYPGYVEEIAGTAEGAGCSFEELFLANLWGEYLPAPQGQGRRCTDVAVLEPEAALLGHNEDGLPYFGQGLYLVHGQVTGRPSFTVLSYPGSLFGTAFGFNEAGVCFAINTLFPRQVGPGLGRCFAARSLLEAESLDDAVRRVTLPGRSSGFSYNLACVRERRAVHVEVAPRSHALHEVEGAYLHTNHYLELGRVEQWVSESSSARVERGEALLASKAGRPRDAGGVLRILGDEAGQPYPIYRTGTAPDNCATFCSALFDLDARTLRIYAGHPVRDAGACLEFPIPGGS
jgi:predicted choloylglycine hydrolase